MMKSCKRCVLWTIAALMMLGCGEDDGAGSSSAVAGVFDQICDLQRDLTPEGCPDDWNDDIEDQITFCKAIATSFLDTPECLEKAEAMLACAPTREWECWTGGSVAMPKEPDPCDAENAPFNLTEGECVDNSMVTVTGG